MAARRGVLGDAPDAWPRRVGVRTRARYGGPARRAPAAGRVAGHGRRARSRRPHADRRLVAARSELRTARSRRAGPSRRGVVFGPGVAGARGVARAPGPMGRRFLSRRRPWRPRVSGGRGRGGHRIGVHRLVRGALGRYGLACVHARRGVGRPGPSHQVGRGGDGSAGSRGGVSGAPAQRRGRAGGVRVDGRGPGPPAVAHVRAGCQLVGGAGRGPVADGDGGELVPSSGRRHGPRARSGWRSGRGSRCGATSWHRSCSDRRARPWRW